MGVISWPSEQGVENCRVQVGLGGHRGGGQAGTSGACPKGMGRAAAGLWAVAAARCAAGGLAVRCGCPGWTVRGRCGHTASGPPRRRHPAAGSARGGAGSGLCRIGNQWGHRTAGPNQAAAGSSAAPLQRPACCVPCLLAQPHGPLPALLAPPLALSMYLGVCQSPYLRAARQRGQECWRLKQRHADWAAWSCLSSCSVGLVICPRACSPRGERRPQPWSARPLTALQAQRGCRRAR